MSKGKQFYFFNTTDIPNKETESTEYNKKHIRIVTRTGIVLFDSDDYKDEKFVVEIK